MFGRVRAALGRLWLGDSEVTIVRKEQSPERTVKLILPVPGTHEFVPHFYYRPGRYRVQVASTDVGSGGRGAFWFDVSPELYYDLAVGQRVPAGLLRHGRLRGERA